MFKNIHQICSKGCLRISRIQPFETESRFSDTVLPKTCVAPSYRCKQFMNLIFCTSIKQCISKGYLNRY